MTSPSPYDAPPTPTGPYVGQPAPVQQPYGIAPAWGWPPPPPAAPAREPIDWQLETIVAVVGTLYLAICGAVAGLLWDGAAPKLSVRAAVSGSSAAYRPQIGADAWFLLVTALVGLVSAIVFCLVVRRPGLGAAVALGVGGLIGAFVADRVGFVAERHVTTTALHALGVQHPGGDVISLIDFRVRALGVISAWPLVALAVLGVFVGIDALRRH